MKIEMELGLVPPMPWTISKHGWLSDADGKSLGKLEVSSARGREAAAFIEKITWEVHKNERTR